MSNQHTYPPGYEPTTGELRPRYGDDAWEILDTLTPGALSEMARLLLAGMIAGKIEQRVTEALNSAPLPEPGKRRYEKLPKLRRKG